MRKCYVEGYDKIYEFHQWIRSGSYNDISAIVEDESGYIKVVDYDKIRFADKLNRGHRSTFAIDNEFVIDPRVAEEMHKEFIGWGQNETRPRLVLRTRYKPSGQVVYLL